MNQPYIIKQAILSEKTYKQMEAGVYTFLVARQATKNQIADAIEKQFSVKVEKVNLSTKPAKTKRITGTRKTAKTQNGRKAIAWLAPGQNIEMLAPKTAKTKKDGKVVKKSQPITRDTVEKKEKKGLFSKLTSEKKKEKDDAN
ncbi:50S ribosomal protein L23 [Candidatus Curtissbacteria bacterium RIFCSPLOWO2_01_FULL_42_26]|uniref:Large ribosomal subunit protein uL23 n=1 Tax=Candidatus Curtissbacteria bacterium RIFCSPLOWO2_01_FULL_42_26 TaxID=1797729 RepID=A0A1F5I1J9_9BACT|nr:MAG: 50S ribosomal protein L23 [Candidatus Curtissbacteria bacterium RIFCSPLOWO2_01_FULL_42_26]